MASIMPGWDRQEIPDRPYGWLQWKGTDACLDFHCRCGGEIVHIDATFLYYLRCRACGRTYLVSGFVRLVELTEDEARLAESRALCAVVSVGGGDDGD